jgi:uncharacterized membrane protein (DUF373 family)
MQVMSGRNRKNQKTVSVSKVAFVTSLFQLSMQMMGFLLTLTLSSIFSSLPDHHHHATVDTFLNILVHG